MDLRKCLLMTQFIVNLTFNLPVPRSPSTVPFLRKAGTPTPNNRTGHATIKCSAANGRQIGSSPICWIIHKRARERTRTFFDFAGIQNSHNQLAQKKISLAPDTIAPLASPSKNPFSRPVARRDLMQIPTYARLPPWYTWQKNMRHWWKSVYQREIQLAQKNKRPPNKTIQRMRLQKSPCTNISSQHNPFLVTRLTFRH